MPILTEHDIDAELRHNIQSWAADAVALLGLNTTTSADAIIRSIDEFIFDWQKGERPELDPDQDLSTVLGSLWGEQLVRELGWQWAAVTFRDSPDAKAVGVFSPDRALAIYPFHFVFGCIDDGCPVTISLAFNMLVDGSRIPELPENAYENVMDNVHHIVPRE